MFKEFKESPEAEKRDRARLKWLEKTPEKFNTGDEVTIPPSTQVGLIGRMAGIRENYSNGKWTFWREYWVDVGILKLVSEDDLILHN